MKTIIQILFFFLLITQICFTQWYQQNSGTTKNLHAVQFIDANTGWAVGDSGTILSTNDGGGNWIPQTSGTTLDLRDVLFNTTTGSTIGWALGDSGTIIKTTDGGTNWIQQLSGTSLPLQNVFFVGEDNGWICGSDYWEQNVLLKTINGGTTWVQQPTDSFLVDLKSIYFINENVGWLLNGISGWGDKERISKTIDGGLTWNTKLQISSGPPNTKSLTKLQFANQNYGIAVGRQRVGGLIYKTTDGGVNWGEQGFSDTLNLAADKFKNLFLIDESLGVVVGSEGSIFHTINSGQTWIERTSGTNNWLNGVYFINELVGWAVGDNGTILHTTNGGVSFVEEERSGEIPTEFLLSQNYPNPFNPSTKIKYSIPQISQVLIKVFDVLGSEIETLVDEEKPAGTYELTWNAANLPSGVYFYQIIAGEFIHTNKMILLK